MEDEMREKRANLTRGIWHSSDNFCSWRHHCYQLSDCDTREYADQELSIQSLLEPRFAQNNMGKLRFTTLNQREV